MVQYFQVSEATDCREQKQEHFFAEGGEDNLPQRGRLSHNGYQHNLISMRRDTLYDPPPVPSLALKPLRLL
jgi:hypothetical protein